MRIGVDARELQGRATGVGRYLRALLREWSRAERDTLILYFNGPAPDERALDLPGVRVRASPRARHGLAWQERELPRLARADALDVFFAPAYACPLRLDLPRVSVVHDVSFYRLPQDFAFLEGLRRRLTVGASLGVSARVIAVSEFSRREILSLRPELAGRVLAVAHGADDDLPEAPAREQARRALGLRGPYLLTVGSIFNRRRLPELLRAVALLRASQPDLRLDVVGDNRTQPPLDLARLVREAGLAAHVRLCGFVDEAALATRYAAADVALFLSDYEGFGLPAMEAATRGVPLVVSARPALSEVYADAALTVDARDPRAVATGVQRLLREPALRDELARRGRALAARHTWVECARRTHEVLAQAADERPAGRRSAAHDAAAPAARADAAALSVVLVSFNTRDDLLAGLRTLFARTRLTLEVFVVDNASADGSAQAVRTTFPQVAVLANDQNVGFGRAVNQALRATRTPYVLLLNPDARLQPGALEALLARLEREPELAGIAPRTTDEDGTPQLSFGPDLSLLAEWRQRRLVEGLRHRRTGALARAATVTQREHEPDWLSAACLLVRSAALHAVGGFDEDFFLYEEDADLCLRLRRAGYRLLHYPAAQATHALGRSARQTPARTRLSYQQSHLRYYRKHRGALEVAGLRALLALEALRALVVGQAPGASPAERRAYGRALLRLALASAP